MIGCLRTRADKIKRYDWLLANACPQAANHCALFWVREWTQVFLTSRPDQCCHSCSIHLFYLPNILLIIYSCYEVWLVKLAWSVTDPSSANDRQTSCYPDRFSPILHDPKFCTTIITIWVRNYLIAVSENVHSKKDSKDQESIQSSTTPYPGYHKEKWQKLNKTSQTRANRLALSQQVTTGQQWTDTKAWQTQGINKTNDPQKSTALERSVFLYWKP